MLDWQPWCGRPERGIVECGDNTDVCLAATDGWELGHLHSLSMGALWNVLYCTARVSSRVALLSDD